MVQDTASGWKSRSLRRALSILLTLAAFAYLFAIVDRPQLLRALAAVPLSAWLEALACSVAALSCGALRWWLLFAAFGAPHRPKLGELVRVYLMGVFYNTYLPGGVGGDVARGIATRRAFEAGSAGAYATVLIDRALGMLALLILVGAATLAHPLPGTPDQRWLILAAGSLVLVGILTLANLRRLARFMPRVIAGLIERLPTPHAWTPLVLGLLISFGSQLAAALCGHVLLRALHPRLALMDSLLIVPLAAASAFVPISVSGAGVRETIFVTLYARVGVPTQTAFAASLCMWAVGAIVAGLGGLYVLASGAPSTTDEPSTHP